MTFPVCLVAVPEELLLQRPEPVAELGRVLDVAKPAGCGRGKGMAGFREVARSFSTSGRVARPGLPGPARPARRRQASHEGRAGSAGMGSWERSVCRISMMLLHYGNCFRATAHITCRTSPAPCGLVTAYSGCPGCPRPILGLFPARASASALRLRGRASDNPAARSAARVRRRRAHAAPRPMRRPAPGSRRAPRGRR